ncbi:hypothetical protein O7606_22800 [Micromonospora sp. WMMD882]|uniref:hypothetical protein n=1 Tax=Micromonospora sp. WMMD882 TaxID=3015151 RepID=UPI00248BBDAD|nr:hypothetical protein [Micromonospora sp. WMMD882]WBB78990.1 hypothetical protein O7606_22800 [Micromonospora sp. WMMD882]
MRTRYEIPEHAPAPVEAVEQAEGGKVVYLTRKGRRVAAVVPTAVAEHSDLDDLEAFWEAQENQVREACRRMWAAVADEDEDARRAIRESIDRILEEIEDAADAAIASAAMTRRSLDGSGIPLAQVVRDFAEWRGLSS